MPPATSALGHRTGRAFGTFVTLLTTEAAALEQGAGKIVAMSIHESADSALVRIICSDADESRDILRYGGFAFSESELLVVELPKRSKQPLIDICAALLAAEINIHYDYPLLVRPRAPMGRRSEC